MTPGDFLLRGGQSNCCIAPALQNRVPGRDAWAGGAWVLVLLTLSSDPPSSSQTGKDFSDKLPLNKGLKNRELR